MVWVLNGLSLTAAPLTNSVKPVALDIIDCTDEEFRDEKKGNLVYLAIKDKNICLFCADVQGKPTLQLKEKNIMDLYRQNKAEKPFLFFRNKEGSTSVFQSVAYPGWFIATSSTPKEPVILTQERGTNKKTNFYLDSDN
ncbi:Interleukin-36 beta [Tupaia chinensis]|uniref:Interleukin-1 n=2 Tax=Tupaia chinensis TaxID=246437 RepID=L9JQQ2_TUPCH|nr:Interleukin-36 beta [Tupaia chinensis]